MALSQPVALETLAKDGLPKSAGPKKVGGGLGLLTSWFAPPPPPSFGSELRTCSMRASLNQLVGEPGPNLSQALC